MTAAVRAAILAAILLAGCAGPASFPPKSATSAPATGTVVHDGKALPPPLPIAPIADFSPGPNALIAFRRACPKLLQARSAGLIHPGDWAAACADPEPDPSAFFTRHFLPVRRAGGGGLATGYYEPEITAHSAPAAGRVAILGRPPELVDIDLAAFLPDRRGQLRGMVKGSRVVPAPDRAAIEAGAFAGRGLELAWADPVDLFFLQIQGSGKLRFADGRTQRIGYAGQNGHPYVAIGRLLKQRGQLEAAGMAEIRAWLAANPDAGRALMRENPSYVFLAVRPPELDGPTGALGVPLLAEANAATDPEAIPPGTPIWVETMVEGIPFRRLLIAADTGGAIRGANRVDIFFGAGDVAARKAGALAAPATTTMLLPRPAAARLSP